MADKFQTDNRGPRGWHYRGYLPHFDVGSVPQSITFRLADALPVAVLDSWKAELDSLPDKVRDVELRKRIEEYVDRGLGACHLRSAAIAEVVESAFLHFHEVRYDLLAWVVMPNHVHVLVQPHAGSSVSAMVHSWKSFTAHEANRILNREGPFWQADYFDRFIRDEEHLRRVVEYFENNPVKAGLCTRPEDWPYGSARRRVHPESAAVSAAGRVDTGC